MAFLEKIKQLWRKFKYFRKGDFTLDCEYDLATNKTELRDCTQIQLAYIMDMMATHVVKDDACLVLAIQNVRKSNYGDYIELISTPVDHEDYTVSSVLVKEIPKITSRWAVEFINNNPWVKYYVHEKEVV